jgi:hypothetical protein
MLGLLLGQPYVGTVCHRYSAINVLFRGFPGMHSTLFLPHQDFHAKITTAQDAENICHGL